MTRIKYILMGAGIGALAGAATGGLISHLSDRRKATDISTTADDDLVEGLMDELRPASVPFDEYNSDREGYRERDS